MPLKKMLDKRALDQVKVDIDCIQETKMEVEEVAQVLRVR